MSRYQIRTLSAEKCNNHCAVCHLANQGVAESSGESRILMRGVEPTLHPAFLETIEKFRGCAVESNGRAFAYPDFCDACLSAGVSEFRIYLFGADAEMHDSQTAVQGSFHQSLQGIRNLLRKNASVVVLLVVTKANYAHLERLPELLRELGVRRVALLYHQEHYQANARTMDNLFFRGAARKIRNLVLQLEQNGLIVVDNEYPDSVDFRTLFNSIGEPAAMVTCGAHNRRLLKESFGQNRAKNYPLTIFLELTYNCNFQCIMCPRPAVKQYNPALDMPFDMFKRIADELFPHAEYVQMAGFGESTIMKDFLRYVDYGVQFPCKFGMPTNLSVGNQKIWEKLVASHFFLSGSFDGASKETFENIRRGADFSKVVRNLRFIVRMMEKYESPASDLKLTTVVQKANYKELPAIVELASDVGVRQLRFVPCRAPVDSIVDRERLFSNPALLRQYVEEALRLGEKYNIRIEIGMSLNLPGNERGFRLKRRCHRPWTRVFVTRDGKIGPCDCLIGAEPTVLGDLNQQSFHEAWNSFEFQLFRKMIHSKNRLQECDWCFRNRYEDVLHPWKSPVRGDS